MSRCWSLELTWSWLRYQPESALSVWFRERFGSGGKRLRRIGIVAVARKLLVSLWKYLETGLVPAALEIIEMYLGSMTRIMAVRPVSAYR